MVFLVYYQIVMTAEDIVSSAPFPIRAAAAGLMTAANTARRRFSVEIWSEAGDVLERRVVEGHKLHDSIKLAVTAANVKKTRLEIVQLPIKFRVEDGGEL